MVDQMSQSSHSPFDCGTEDAFSSRGLISLTQHRNEAAMFSDHSYQTLQCITASHQDEDKSATYRDTHFVLSHQESGKSLKNGVIESPEGIEGCRNIPFEECSRNIHKGSKHGYTVGVDGNMKRAEKGPTDQLHSAAVVHQAVTSPVEKLPANHLFPNTAGKAVKRGPFSHNLPSYMDPSSGLTGMADPTINSSNSQESSVRNHTVTERQDGSFHAGMSGGKADDAVSGHKRRKTNLLEGNKQPQRKLSLEDFAPTTMAAVVRSQSACNYTADSRHAHDALLAHAAANMGPEVQGIRPPPVQHCGQPSCSTMSPSQQGRAVAAGAHSLVGIATPSKVNNLSGGRAVIKSPVPLLPRTNSLPNVSMPSSAAPLPIIRCNSLPRLASPPHHLPHSTSHQTCAGLSAAFSGRAGQRVPLAPRLPMLKPALGVSSGTVAAPQQLLRALSLPPAGQRGAKILSLMGIHELSGSLPALSGMRPPPLLIGVASPAGQRSKLTMSPTIGQVSANPASGVCSPGDVPMSARLPPRTLKQLSGFSPTAPLSAPRDKLLFPNGPSLAAPGTATPEKAIQENTPAQAISSSSGSPSLTPSSAQLITRAPTQRFRTNSPQEHFSVSLPPSQASPSPASNLPPWQPAPLMPMSWPPTTGLRDIKFGANSLSGVPDRIVAVCQNVQQMVASQTLEPPIPPFGTNYNAEPLAKGNPSVRYTLSKPQPQADCLQAVNPSSSSSLSFASPSESALEGTLTSVVHSVSTLDIPESSSCSNLNNVMSRREISEPAQVINSGYLTAVSISPRAGQTSDSAAASSMVAEDTRTIQVQDIWTQILQNYEPAESFPPTNLPEQKPAADLLTGGGMGQVVNSLVASLGDQPSRWRDPPPGAGKTPIDWGQVSSTESVLTASDDEKASADWPDEAPFKEIQTMCAIGGSADDWGRNKVAGQISSEDNADMDFPLSNYLYTDDDMGCLECTEDVVQLWGPRGTC